MKIINKAKFARGIIIITFIISFICIFSNSVAYSSAEVQLKEIYVGNGETLWSIAREELNNNLYYSNKDVREVISNIKKINNLSSSTLQIGQKLAIPTI